MSSLSHHLSLNRKSKDELKTSKSTSNLIHSSSTLSHDVSLDSSSFLLTIHDPTSGDRKNSVIGIDNSGKEEEEGVLRPSAVCIIADGVASRKSSIVSMIDRHHLQQRRSLSPVSATDLRRLSFAGEINNSGNPATMTAAVFVSTIHSPEQQILDSLQLTHPKAYNFWKDNINTTGNASTLEEFNVALECNFDERVEVGENGKQLVGSAMSQQQKAELMTIHWFKSLVTDSPISKLFKGGTSVNSLFRP